MKVVCNLNKVLAIELICATQGIDFHQPLNTSKKLKPVHNLVRSKIPHLENDRVIFDDISIAEQLINSGELLEVVDVN